MFIFLSTTAISATADNTQQAVENQDNNQANHITNNMVSDVNDNHLKSNTQLESHKSIETKNNTPKSIKKDTTNTNESTTNTTTKKTPTLTVNDDPITPGKESTFIAMKNMDATGKGVFKINGKTISDPIILTADTMIVKYTYLVPENFEAKTYNLTFVYSGNYMYEKGQVSTTINLKPEESNLDPQLSMKNITVKYLDEAQFILNLAPDAKGNVIFKLNHTTVTPKISVVNGTAIYKFNATYYPGVYRLEAKYSGNYKYAPGSFKAYLKINKLASKITINNITSKAGSKYRLNARVMDERGIPVEGAFIVYKINDKTIGNSTTSSIGYAPLNYVIPSNFDSRHYRLKVICNGTMKVAKSNQTADITLTQLKTTLQISKIQAKINETVTITATAIDENKNNAHRGHVIFKINGKKIADVNITNDYAMLRYKPSTNEATKYNVSAEYRGIWKYAGSKANSTIEVIKIGTITTTRYTDAKCGMQTTVSARVEDKNQVLVNGGIVVFTLNGTYLGNATVKNGAANYTFIMPRYPEGVYRLNATYKGSGSYLSSNNLNYVNVTVLNSRIITSPVTLTVGQKANISVYIMDESSHYAENGEVEFTLNGTKIGKAIVKNGTASIIYKPPYKFSGLTLRYIATLKANKFYSAAYSINNITISPLKDVYVSNKGNNNNLGDKTHPFKSLYYAVGHVATFGTVHVLDGTYNENTILINNSIKIKGSSYNTKINGKATGKTIFTVTKSDALLTLEDLTITNGLSKDNRSAGAIKSYGKLNIAHVRFIANKGVGTFSAGAIYSTGLMNITNVEFINNTINMPNAEGGALRLINNTTNIINSNFQNNQAIGTNSTGGGAIYMQDGSLIINSTNFIDNKAKGTTTLGGAIKGTYGDMVISKVTFKNNMANSTQIATGGAISSLGCGLYLNLSTFDSNKAYSPMSASAGALYSQYAAVMSYNCRFLSNYVQASGVLGAAVQGFYAYSNFVNCTFNKNLANATKSNSFGGVIYYETGNLTISSSHFTDNQAKSVNVSIGGAIYSHANTTIYHSDFNSNKATGKNIGGGAIGNLGNMTVSQTNFIKNNASKVGNAITAVSGAKTVINGNYWYAQNPKWTELLRGSNKPSNYSKTPIKH